MLEQDDDEEFEMKLSDSDRKKLWARAANICSYEGCNEELFVKFENDVNIGKECHIHSPKTGGPRYRSKIKDTETYDNAILLCGKHHDIIDHKENLEKYTPEKLKEMKQKHESWVSETLKENNKRSERLKKHIQEINDLFFECSYCGTRGDVFIDLTEDKENETNPKCPNCGREL